MKTVEIKYQKQAFTMQPFNLPWGEETDGAIEDATDQILDRIDADFAIRFGAMPPPYTSTRAFKRRLERAKTELEIKRLETLKMLFETFIPA